MLNLYTWYIAMDVYLQSGLKISQQDGGTHAVANDALAPGSTVWFWTHCYCLYKHFPSFPSQGSPKIWE